MLRASYHGRRRGLQGGQAFHASRRTKSLVAVTLLEGSAVVGLAGNSIGTFSDFSFGVVGKRLLPKVRAKACVFTGTDACSHNTTSDVVIGWEKYLRVCEYPSFNISEQLAGAAIANPTQPPGPGRCSRRGRVWCIIEPLTEKS